MKKSRTRAKHQPRISRFSAELLWAGASQQLPLQSACWSLHSATCHRASAWERQNIRSLVSHTARVMDGKFIAYYRVSTDHQGVDGNGMAAQRKAVEDYLNGGCWKLLGEFTEVESGKRSDRPELEKALKACRKHKAKLVIAKLDRLSRNVHFISGLMERKVDFVACDMPTANLHDQRLCRGGARGTPHDQ
jgi:Resolvase, N terminal domain